MPTTDPSSLGDIFVVFLGILFEGVPYILLGTLISGIIDAYLPNNALDRFLPKSNILSILMSGLLGLLLPVCECAVVPVIRRLVKKGLPLSCALTYMFSAPIVNPITALSTWKAFSNRPPGSWESSAMMTCSRLLIAYLVCVGIGFAVRNLRPNLILVPKLLTKEPEDDSHSDCHHCEDHSHDHRHEHDHDHCHDHSHNHNHHSTSSKLVAATRTAQRDFLDVVLYFSAGAFLAALFITKVKQSSIEELASGFNTESLMWGNDLIGVSIMMALAFFLSLCSTSDAFLVAQMGAFTVGSKLAFLIFGPMVDLKLIFLYSTIFKKKFLTPLIIALFFIIGMIGMTWTYLSLQS